MVKKLKVTEKERIDKWIVANSSLSRADVQKMIRNQTILVDGIQVRKSNFNVSPGQEISITEKLQKEIKAKPENLPLEIVFEDDHLIVVNKKSGMVVHPAPGHPSGTLVNALLYHFDNLSGVNGSIRPGIVHRIDKDTSGLLIVAKDDETHQALAQLLKEHKIKRKYKAWVEGKITNDVIHIDLPIGRDPRHRQKMAVTREHSKESITHVYVEKVFDDKTLIKCELETGRTHQIRVHLAHIKHPVLGDPVYGQNNKDHDFGQQLHAYELEFVHPQTKKKLQFTAPLPKEFIKA